MKLMKFAIPALLAFSTVFAQQGAPTGAAVDPTGDEQKALEGLKSFIDSLKTVSKVEILPYHRMGVPEYERLGIDYPLKEVQPPTKEEVERASKILGLKL